MRKLTILATISPFVLGVFACAQDMRVHGMSLSRSGVPVPGGLAPLCASYLTGTVCAQLNSVTRDGLGNDSVYVPVGFDPNRTESYGSRTVALAQPDQSGNGFGSVDPVSHQTTKGDKSISRFARCGNFENVRCVDALNTFAWAGTDVCGWINAAYAASPSNGAPIIVHPGAYTCASGSFIKADTNNKPLIMICQNGATSSIGASPPGVCQITFSDTTHAGITISDGAGMGAGVSGFTLIGPGTETATIGILVALAVGHVFQNNDISGFGVGVQVGTTTNSEYINTFWINAFHDNGQNLNFPNGGTSVENDAFYGGRISNQAAAFVANCINIGGGVEVHFYNVSIDQCGMTLHGMQPKVSMTGGHFENPISGTAIPFFTSAADVTGAVVTMDAVLWIEDVASARTEFASIRGAGQYNFSNSLFQTEGGPVAAAVTVNNGNAAVLTQNLSLVGVTKAFNNTLSNSVLNIAPGNVQYVAFGENAFAVGFSVDHNYVTTLYGQYPETHTIPAALATKDRCYADSTSHTIQCSYNGKPFHSMTQGIGAGTSTSNGTAIAAGTSQAQPGISLSGVTATDVALCSLNASPPASWQTGIQMLPPVVTDGVVTPWLSNPTTSSITPAATAIRCMLFR